MRTPANPLWHYQPAGWIVPYCGSRGANVHTTAYRDRVTCRRCRTLMGRE